MRRLLVELRWLLLACVGAAVPAAWVLASGHTLVWRDTAQLNGALRPMIVESLRHLRVPGWNPWEGTGQPIFAQLLHGVLHPVSIGVALLTTSTDALIVALILFGALGAWVAARGLRSSPAAAAGAALAFASSGYVLSMADNTSYLMPTATGPWAVAGLVASARHRLGWAAGAAATAALALSGDPGSLFAFTIIGAGLAWSEARWRGLIQAGLGAALGFALAAIQYVPSWVYLADTARGAGLLNPGDLHRWALAPWRVLELAAPGFFVGVPRSYDAPVFALLDGATPDRFPFTPSVFVGAAVLLLAAVGARRNRAARWLLGLALLFLWLSLGHRAGSQQALSWVPVWGALRYWEKMVGPLTLCLSLAAGAGVDALGVGPSRAVAKAAAVAAGLGIIVAVALSFPGVSGALRGDVAAAELARRNLQVGLAQASMGLAALTAAVTLGAWRPNLLAGAVVAVLFLQSAAASPFALHLGERAVLEVRPPELAAPPPGPRVVAPLGCDFREARGSLDAIDLLNACERRTGRPSTNAEGGVDSVATYSSLTPGRWDMIIGAGQLFWPLARRFATSHVLAHPPTTEAEAEGLRAATLGATGFQALDRGQLLVWEVPHRPWASFAPSVRVARGREEAGAILAEELEADRPTVVVETRGAPPAVSSGRVLSVHRGAEEVLIEAESGADALLVVNDAWSPGWRAFVDGAEAELMPTDVLVRAVRWPAGRHRLVMRYEVPGLLVGEVVSGLAVLVGAGALAWQRRRAPPRPS